MSLAALERAKLLSSASTSQDVGYIAPSSQRKPNRADPLQKRQYLEHLLTLPAYKDPQLTAYFAESVSLHFADVGDLQDQAVDSVLDLCEDEDEKVSSRNQGMLRWTLMMIDRLESAVSRLWHV